jgi:TrmH family RNA methyltransferase
MDIIIDCIKKSQNLSAILRIAAATQTSVCITGGDLDHRHPKMKRHLSKWHRTDRDIESLVKIDRYPLLDEAVADFQARGYRAIGTSPGAKLLYTDLDYTQGKHVFVFGNEETGLGGRKLALMDQIIRIPIYGEVDSLNLAVSVGVILYEGLRQSTVSD